MNEVERDRILKQALFLGGHDGFAREIAEKEESFASLLMSILRVSHPELKVWTEDGSNNVCFSDPTLPDGISVKGFLTPSRLFQMLRPDDMEYNGRLCRDQFVPHVVNSVAEMHRKLAGMKVEGGTLRNETHDIAKAVPLLKSLDMVAGMNASFVKQGLPDEERYRLVTWPFLGRVAYVAAFDTPTNFEFIHGSTVEELGVTRDILRERALENLRSAARRVKFRTDYTKPVNEIDRLQGFASSLLLLPEFWEKEATKAKDELVIHVADYDTLMVARKGDRRGLSMLLTLALSGRVESVFNPPVFFVFDKDGMRLMVKSDVE